MDTKSEDNAPTLSMEEAISQLKNYGRNDSFERVMMLKFLYDVYDRARKSIIASYNREANEEPDQSLNTRELYVAIKGFNLRGALLHKVIMDINPKGNFFDDIQTSLKDGPYSTFLKIVQEKDFDLSDASYTVLSYLLRTVKNELEHNIIPELMVGCLIQINVLSEEDVAIIKVLNSEDKSDLFREHTSDAVYGVITRLILFLSILNHQGKEEEDCLSCLQDKNALPSDEQAQALSDFAHYGSTPSVVRNLYYMVRVAIQQKEAEVFGAELQNATQGDAIASQDTKVAAEKDKRFNKEECQLFASIHDRLLERNTRIIEQKRVLKRLYLVLTGVLSYNNNYIEYIDKSKCGEQDFSFLFGLSDKPEDENCCIDWKYRLKEDFTALIYTLFKGSRRLPTKSKYYKYNGNTLKFSDNRNKTENSKEKMDPWKDIISFCQQEDKEKGSEA